MITSKRMISHKLLYLNREVIFRLIIEDSFPFALVLLQISPLHSKRSD